MNEERFIVGKISLNPVKDKHTPCIEILLDTASGRGDGEIVLLKEIAKEDREYYLEKVMEKEKNIGKVKQK